MTVHNNRWWNAQLGAAYGPGDTIMDNLPDPQTITTANDALRTLLGVCMGALQANDGDDSITELKILLMEVRKGLQAKARAGRTERTRYFALTATALEEAEGWLYKAQMEDA